MKHLKKFNEKFLKEDKIEEMKKPKFPKFRRDYEAPFWQKTVQYKDDNKIKAKIDTSKPPSLASIKSDVDDTHNGFVKQIECISARRELFDQVIRRRRRRGKFGKISLLKIRRDAETFGQPDYPLQGIDALP